ncbi:MAG: 6-carboxytetrahydropterin synthase [Bacteroidota bacterium]
MTKIRISKIFNFEAAHALFNYDGLCKHIHGHSYKLYVCVSGIVLCNSDNPKNGMLMDFGDLKKIVKKEIVDVFDHTLILNNKINSNLIIPADNMFSRILYTDYQPTSENMVVDFAEKIMKKLPSNIKLHSLRLHETESSFAEWFAEDNV